MLGDELGPREVTAPGVELGAMEGTGLGAKLAKAEGAELGAMLGTAEGAEPGAWGPSYPNSSGTQRRRQASLGTKTLAAEPATSASTRQQVHTPQVTCSCPANATPKGRRTELGVRGHTETPLNHTNNILPNKPNALSLYRSPDITYGAARGLGSSESPPNTDNFPLSGRGGAQILASCETILRQSNKSLFKHPPTEA